jgi:hypothetical protein
MKNLKDEADPVAKCCDLCADTECGGWQYGFSGNTWCKLFNNTNTLKRGENGCVANGMKNPPPGPAPAPGAYNVNTGEFKLPNGYFCGSNSSTKIFYPDALDKGPFPVLSFGHGTGGSTMDKWLNTIASVGFVILAPETGDCNQHGDDIRGNLVWCKGNSSLHPALSHVDWTRAGIFGHSFGSAWATAAVTDAVKEPDVYHVKAALFSHGGSDASGCTVPAMATSGRGSRGMWGLFSSIPGRPKVYAEAPGAGHMEPLQGGRLNMYEAYFLHCHIADDKGSCTHVYGGNGHPTMCEDKDNVDPNKCNITTSAMPLLV